MMADAERWRLRFTMTQSFPGRLCDARTGWGRARAGRVERCGLRNGRAIRDMLAR